MRKSPAPRRTDEELIAAITARLNYKPGTKTGIADSINVSHERTELIIEQMLENGEIEMYRGKAGTHVCDLYCIVGSRPSPMTASSLRMWAQTLAGFREAVQGATNAGRDPFKVTA